MSNKNAYKIFKVANPMLVLDALWERIKDIKDLSEILIFLPSRRAIRGFEKMVYEKTGHAVILPQLIPLGSGVEELGADEDDAISDTEDNDIKIVSNRERVIKLACLLTQVGTYKINDVLFLAHDFIRMQDYLENQNNGMKLTDKSWQTILGGGTKNGSEYEKYCLKKAELLDCIKEVMEEGENKTEVQKNKEDIKALIPLLGNYKKVIVCGSTASVPTTAELMLEIAKRDNGEIILSGFIPDGLRVDEKDTTNPYYSEYKFLKKLDSEMEPEDVEVLFEDKKSENIDFLNKAFFNTGEHIPNHNMDKFHLIECQRESIEARAVAYIAKKVIEEDKNKTVLVVTPDAAGNQRIKTEFDALGLEADFSYGIPGNMTDLGRAILNLFDKDKFKNDFDKSFNDVNKDIFELLSKYFEQPASIFEPKVDINDVTKKNSDKNKLSEWKAIWKSIKATSDVLKVNLYLLEKYSKPLTYLDIRGLIADAISSVSVRKKLDDNCNIRVLGMVEARMQKADVIILTGLNDGMFPAKGYENAWLPRKVSLEEIGLPSPNKKVSLMALDFINLSCANEVYWLRTSQSGEAVNLESRFLSRVAIAHGDEIERDKKTLEEVLKSDKNVPEDLIEFNPPTMEIKPMELYITKLDDLNEDNPYYNPYNFYVTKMLGLKIEDDEWVFKKYMDFGTAVHDGVSKAIENKDLNAETLKENIMLKLKETIGEKVSDQSALYYYWNRRISEISKYLEENCQYILTGISEQTGSVDDIKPGYKISAKADVVWPDKVLDVKTGKIPEFEYMKNKGRWKVPALQVPFEGYILQTNGIGGVKASDVPQLEFICLKRGEERIHLVEPADEIIESAKEKVRQIIDKYTNPETAKYEFKDYSFSANGSPSPDKIKLKNFAKFDD